MYAITHATTALALKRRYPSAGLWPLLVSVQAIELLWVCFVYAGIEYVVYTPDAVHLGFLPYSHSVGSCALVALLAWMWCRFGRHNPVLAIAVGIGVMSHVVLDIIHHEPDIAWLAFASSSRIGFGLAMHPLIDFAVELCFGIACWAIFRGSKLLLAIIVLFNLTDLPLMLPKPGSGAMLSQHPAVLPTIILIQIVLTWVGVWYFATKR